MNWSLGLIDFFQCKAVLVTRTWQEEIKRGHGTEAVAGGESAQVNKDHEKGHQMQEPADHERVEQSEHETVGGRSYRADPKKNQKAREDFHDCDRCTVAQLYIKKKNPTTPIYECKTHTIII